MVCTAFWMQSLIFPYYLYYLQDLYYLHYTTYRTYTTYTTYTTYRTTSTGGRGNHDLGGLPTGPTQLPHPQEGGPWGGEVAIPSIRGPLDLRKLLEHLWSTLRQATPFCFGMQASLVSTECPAVRMDTAQVTALKYIYIYIYGIYYFSDILFWHSIWHLF